MNLRSARPPKPLAGVTLDPSTALVGVHKSPENDTWGGLRKSLRALEKSTELIPPINTAINAVIGCLDVVQAVASNREDYVQLTADLTSMVDALNQYAGELGSDTNHGSIASITQSICDEVVGIQQQQERRTLGRLLDAISNQDDVARHYQRIEKLFRQLQCQVTLRISSGVQKQMELCVRLTTQP
ncbi:hypothetical protein OPQ81_002879 [Rhizoctonia solani]|nr:hypothetical protein OPQ81_002879 [Rhizoctonia solani]